MYGTSHGFHIIGASVMSLIICYTFIPVLYELQLTSAYEVNSILFTQCQGSALIGLLLFFNIYFMFIILQYLELRYDKRLRVFGSVLFTVYLVRLVLMEINYTYLLNIILFQIIIVLHCFRWRGFL